MNYPRVRDLPEVEQDAFAHWVSAQTRPLIEGVLEDEQDAYYQHDYELWKEQGMPLEQRRVTWD